MDLKQFQTLLYRCITAPEALTIGLGKVGELSPGSIERLVVGNQHLSAVERIHIYADAYFYRLLDCLREEFPATLAVVGPANFASLVREYLQQYPPTEPSILYAGEHLAHFLCNHSLAERWPFIADLATLERVILDVFHAPDTPALSVEALRTIPPQRWPMLKVQAHPTVEIFPVEWPVVDLLGAVESGRNWSEPRRHKGAVIVWRQHAQVRYRNLENVEARAFALVLQGATFAAICDSIAAGSREPDQEALIRELLARWVAWVADGMIMAGASPQPSCLPMGSDQSDITTSSETFCNLQASKE